MFQDTLPAINQLHLSDIVSSPLRVRRRFRFPLHRITVENIMMEKLEISEYQTNIRSKDKINFV